MEGSTTKLTCCWQNSVWTVGLRVSGFFVVVIVVLYRLSFGSCPEYLSWLLSEDCFQFFVTQASPT